MRKVITLLVLSVLSIGYNSSAFGQDSTIVEPKNIIYATGGTLGLWFTANFNYERLVAKTKDRKYLIKCYAHGSAGAYATWGGSGPTYVTSVKGVLGRKNSHLELGIGIAALVNNYEYDYSYQNYVRGSEPKPKKLDYWWILPAATIGYRYQKPGEAFVFRTGVGFPDGVYISFGGAF